jgi:hypothetical protein
LADISAAGRVVVGGESDKMLDQKMQEKKVYRKDVSDEQLKVVKCIGHETLKCKSAKSENLSKSRHIGDGSSCC